MIPLPQPDPPDEDRMVAFEQLLSRARQGDSQAANELYQRYSKPIHRVVRRKLDRRLRRRFDSIDFLQSVWGDFFQLPSDNYQFESPEALVVFLARVAYNKVVEVTRRRLQTRKDDVRREVSFDQIVKPEENKGEPFPAPYPTPSQEVMADERWEQLTENLPEGHRRILELLRLGHTYEEISGRLNVHPKVVQRLVARLRRNLDQK